MPEPLRILTPDQHGVLAHTLTFLRMCSIHLENSLPALSDVDEIRTRNLKEMGRKCAENIERFFLR